MGRLKPVFFILFLALLCVSLLLGFAAFWQTPKAAQARFGPPSAALNFIQVILLSSKLNAEVAALNSPGTGKSEPAAFVIAPGETTPQIIDRLFQEGWISSGEVFRDYLVYKGFDTLLQSGTFMLTPGLSPMDIANQLVNKDARLITLRVFAGWRLEEIAQAVANSGLSISEDEFLEMARQPPANYGLRVELPETAGGNGFLFPGSYTFERYASSFDVVEAMYAAFNTNLPPAYVDGFANASLDIYEATTLASIVQREAVLEEEMPMIASVYFNRLRTGMLLQADPTVQYAIGSQHPDGSWWKNPLYFVDLDTVSSYNTYRNPGLPPGPISSPSLKALEAVAFPAETGFYFFRAACDHSGKHNFSVTYEEHLSLACPEP